MNASKALKSASMVLAESPIALQLRYLQTLTTVTTEKNSTIVSSAHECTRGHWWHQLQ